MSTLERLRELDALRKRNWDHPAIDALTEEAIDQSFDALPKLLAVVEAVEFLKLDRKAPEDMTGREFRLHQAYRLLLEGG